MLRKIGLAVCVIALIGALSPDVASARGGFGGGGFHGGGFHGGGFRGGFGGGGFRTGGGSWRGRGGRGWYGAAAGVALGLGLAAGSYTGYPYGEDDDYPSGYGEYAEYGPWARNNSYVTGCYPARLRVWTAYGWRWRAVQVCD